MTRSINLALGEDPVPYLIDELTGLSPAKGRQLFALVGGPGAGKSTLAAALVAQLNAHSPGRAVHIPMDGFHMKQTKLDKLNLGHRKGAPETFESAAFVQFLSELKGSTNATTGPSYSRKIEDVVEDGYTIGPEARLLVVEGNYLLLPNPPWDQLAALLDRSVYLEVPQGVVRRRLLRRHGAEGRFSHQHVTDHVRTVDLPNFELVQTTRHRADLILTLT